MELRQVKGNTWVLDSWELIPLYRLDAHHCVLLDTGTWDQRDELEAALEAKGVDVIVDDRAERPGVKFKDADLIGFPVRVVVGAKGLANGGVEVKRRDQDKSQTKVVPVAEAAAAVIAALG